MIRSTHAHKCMRTHKPLITTIQCPSCVSSITLLLTSQAALRVFCFALRVSAAASVVWKLLQSKIKNELYPLIHNSALGIDMANEVFSITDTLAHDIIDCSFTEGEEGGKRKRAYTRASQVKV